MDEGDAVDLWTAEIEALRPEARRAVAGGFALVQELLGPPTSEDPDDALSEQRSRMARLGVPVPEGADREIAGVRCRTFLPGGTPSAVYLHFHGGGMTRGTPEMNDASNLDLCRRFGLAVVSVDYRLAPEHPYPAGPDDGVAVAEWLLRHGEDELGASRLVVGGESAGAYMAAAVLLRVRDDLDAVERVDGANLVFGVYDWGRSPSQRGARAHDGPDFLDPHGIRVTTEQYLPGRTDDDRRDSAISPAFADLRDLPPALMSVGTCDHLLDDTLLLAGRWGAANDNVDLFVAPDMPHAFMAFPCGITDAWARRTRDWFAEVLAPPRAG